MTLQATKLMTAEELVAMGDIGRCELIYGELVMMSPAALERGIIASRFCRFMTEFVDRQGLGVVVAAETGFMVERGPDLLRAADAAFVSNARLGGPKVSGYLIGVPDLAVEVISPTERRRDVAEKVNMWLAHGTTTVWLADPSRLTVTIHRTGAAPVVLGMADELRDEPTLPGFVLPLSNVFRRP